MQSNDARAGRGRTNSRSLSSSCLSLLSILTLPIALQISIQSGHLLGGAPEARAALPPSPEMIAAADDPRLDPRLGAVLRMGDIEGAGNGIIAKTEFGVAVMIRGKVDPSALEAIGAVVGTQAGPITTADVPLVAIPSLLATAGVEAIEAAGVLEPQLTVSCPAIDADYWWQYVPPSTFTGTTGAGVVIGIVDTGIDFTNSDFKKTNNQTRIKYIWDQTTIGTPPSGFTYGAEWTESQINAGTPSERDTDGHGTHIAGIAAGDGSSTGLGFPAYRYIGIAPMADLIVVKGTTQQYTVGFVESKVIDGVNYIFQKANALGKDAV